MLADALGRPLRFSITAGQAHDITTAPALLEGQQAGAVLADKAYDSNGLRETIAQMEAQAVIPSKRNRKLFIPHDAELYKQRNRIERCCIPPAEAVLHGSDSWVRSSQCK
jgi:transposase